MRPFYRARANLTNLYKYDIILVKQFSPSEVKSMRKVLRILYYVTVLVLSLAIILLSGALTINPASDDYLKTSLSGLVCILSAAVFVLTVIQAVREG